ncbi:WD repeat-containing protein 97-like isoform X3 [Mercenaria mercenaria]|uniref:WD repeat-containing protein 97-like isoform X3 n=1 Tax=Mercenaria mercenaria TaxID=6596 RepID=UPI00234F0C28|nr:WD repeat-containing protein 97-like isoform X3 [Mercenaria mercenaria]
MTAIASMMVKQTHTMLSEETEDEEPMSKQLEILMERRRQEEVRKARFHWALLRSSIKNTITAVKESDEKNVLISHGIHHLRKMNHSTELKQVMFIKELDEYLTTDGKTVRLFLSDGRKKKTYTPEEPMDHISYCSSYKQYVGWITGGDELFLMNSEFEIISQSRAPSKIVLAEYNKHTSEYITVGPGYFVTWAFRYGARHLIPRKMNRTEYKENNMFSHMVLEGTASRSQKIFLSVHNSVVVYNVFDGKQLSYKKDLHERDITTMTFFNPLKYLITGALDGTIKIWDNKWHVQMVFVGHTGSINALDIYPHGSAIISACADKTIRVWNLDTCDEVDRATLDGPVTSLQTTLDYDTFFTFCGQTVDMWKIQHLYQIHTSVGQRVVKIKQTSHPNFSTRSVVMSRDSSVRLVSPVSGDVITTLLLSPNKGLVDVAYAIEQETMFCVLSNGDILKVRTDTNPCHVVKQWKYEDPEKEACNYLFVYEYVVDIQLKTDTWAAIKRGVTTKSLNVPEEDEDDDDDSRSQKKKKNMNRTLLLGGRKDGYICVYDWETGKVDFKIDAHGSKGVMSMIANAKVDQLISAGKDNVIKVWRVYPFVQEALAPLMSFFCAHLPLHMTMIKTNLCVAFQDHATATYSVVMYNLRDRKKIFDEGDHYRYDHEPGDDHAETITGLSACSRLKLYASSSLDGTIRIWNETNTLVRLLKLKSVPHSVGFCSAKGDLLVGIDNHLYKIPHYVYLPKSYMFRMVSMKFGKQAAEHPLPETQEITQKMTKNDLSRLKNSHSSFKYSTFTDILTPEEEEEINRERLIKEKAFNLLLNRENELAKIRNGELMSRKKPKTTAKTKKVAFTQYMKMFYDKPKPTIPKDDPYPEDTVKDAVKEPEVQEKEEYHPEREPTGFFPPASEATRPTPPEDSPLKAAYHLAPNGFVPNSILIKLLWPQEAKDKMAQRKKEEWKLPSFSEAQLAAINKVKQEREEIERRAQQQANLEKWPSLDSWRANSGSTVSKPQSALTISSKRTLGSGQKSVTFLSVRSGKGDGEEELLEEDEDEFEDRVMEMDWGDDEDTIYKEKSKLSDTDGTKSSLMNKYADIMAKPPTPQPEEEAITKEDTLASKEKTMESTKQTSDLSQKSTPREIKPTKPIKKLVSRPPPPPPQPKTKTPPPPKKETPEQKHVDRVKTPVPKPVTPPPPRQKTPLPGFITQFKGVEWFEKYFPNCENTIPKPWSLENFVAALVKLIKTVDYSYKIAIVEALLMLHAQDEFADSLSHSVMKAMTSVLNHQKDYPTCMIEDQRNFIIVCIKGMQKLLTSPDKEFVTELLVQFLDGDKEVRAVVNTILTSIGMQDQHKFLPKELDSWDIWNVEEDDRKSDLRKMCHQWLDRWMTTYKLHLEDTIERMKKGQNIHGRMSRDQFKKKGSSSPQSKSILRRSVGVGTDTAINEDQETITTLDDAGKRGVTVTFDKPPDPALIENATYIDAINYFCDMMFEKEIEAMRAPGKRMPGSKENVVQAKNTVLVLPKIPHKPSLVRLGETHTSHCRPHRETNLHVDYRLPPQTARGYHPFPGQISGFVNSINLPMKPLMLNPFPNALDALDARFQEPILITLKSAQKYFVPSQSIVPQEAVPAAL